jgi:hypothetical protein
MKGVRGVRRARWMLGVVAMGLFLSGVTVWPAVSELKAAEHLVWGDQPTGQIGGFVDKALEGLQQTQNDYPFMLYAHDWLAFAHIVLAIMFAGAIRDPVRNKWTVQCGLVMCVLIPVLAGICIPLRGLPWPWFFIDTAFGVIAGALLLVALRDIVSLERAAAEPAGAPASR